MKDYDPITGILYLGLIGLLAVATFFVGIGFVIGVVPAILIFLGVTIIPIAIFVLLWYIYK